MFFAHFDVDAFYASVEIRDNPQLRGKPVAVAGSSRRAVVLTASYEARPFGVRSAVPLWKAREACPQLIVVPPNMHKYSEVSREIFAIFREQGHPVEGLSRDEAFVELGDCTFDEARVFAQHVRARVADVVRLTVSAGVASGMMLAKIASDACKPNGLLAIEPGTEEAFLAPLPVGRLWGVGPKTQTRLQGHGIATIGDVAALDAQRLRAIFGTYGEHVAQLARGIDPRRVHTGRETKSISTEETFEYDISEEDKLIDVLRGQARELAASLEKDASTSSTIGVKIKRADFSSIVRQVSLREPTRDARRIFRAAVHCLRRAELKGTPVRLLGTRVANITEGEHATQLNLFARENVSGPSGSLEPARND